MLVYQHERLRRPRGHACFGVVNIFETGLLDKPCRRYFDTSVIGRPAWHSWIIGLQLRKCALIDDRVGEERAIVGDLGRVGQLGRTDGDNGVADHARRRIGDVMLTKVLLDRAVKRRRRVTMQQMQSHGSDKETPAIGSLKPACAIAKPAVHSLNIDELFCLCVVGLDADQRVGDLLAVGPDILNRRGSGGTRNKAERFDTSHAFLGDTSNDAIPVLAGPNCDVIVLVVFLLLLKPHNFINDYQAREALIPPDNIAAAANHNRRQLPLGRPFQRFTQLISIRYLCQIGRGATKTHRRMQLKRHTLQDIHGFSIAFGDRRRFGRQELRNPICKTGRPGLACLPRRRYYKIMSEKQQEQPFKQLGDRLKTLRQKLHESVAEVSGAVEIDEPTLHRIEQGHERPAEDILMLLISHFGMQDDEAAGLWQLAGYDQEKFDRNNRSDSSNEDGSGNRSAVLVMAVDPRIIYSDGVQVTASNNGVIVSFSQGNGTPGVLTTAKIGMSREQAYAVIRTLQDALTRSEPRQLPADSQSKPQDNQTSDK